MFRILIAEEDSDLRKEIVKMLEKHGYMAIAVANGAEALEVVEREHINLIICDVMMSPIDGYELSNILKEKKIDIPVLMLFHNFSAKSEKFDFLRKSEGILDSDDIDSILEKLQKTLEGIDTKPVEKIKFGDLSINLLHMSLEVAGVEKQATRQEMQLLLRLVFCPNVIYTRMQLMESFGDKILEGDQNDIDVLTARLQEIIKDSKEVEIVNVSGLGYKIRKKE